jgi:hypothetical protein
LSALKVKYCKLKYRDLCRGWYGLELSSMTFAGRHETCTKYMKPAVSAMYPDAAGVANGSRTANAGQARADHRRRCVAGGAAGPFPDIHGF